MARVEKREGIPDSALPRSYFLFWSRSTIEPSVRFWGPSYWHEKLMPAERFRHSLLEWRIPRNKSKIKRKSAIPILSSYTTERKINREFCFEEDSQLNELWNMSTKQKKKRKILKEKYSNSKSFVSRTLSQISSRKLRKNLPHFIFFIPFFCFFCIKFLFKNCIVCFIFSNQYSN